MSKVKNVFLLAIVIVTLSPVLKAQGGSASGTAGGRRVDFSFPARLGAGKYAVVSLPENQSPVRLTDDGTVIFRQFGFGTDAVGFRWKAGRMTTSLHVPADLRLGGFMFFPAEFQATASGWVLASFFRMPGPPSNATFVWPPGETEPVRLSAPRFPVDGFEPAELILEPVINARGKVWAKVVYPLPNDERAVKFVVWDSIFGEPHVLDEKGWAVTVAGVNAAGTLVGTYTPDPDDPSIAHGFVGEFSNAVDFEPRLINDEGWVVGRRTDHSPQNLAWKEGTEFPLPAGDIEAIDPANNLHGVTPDGKPVMWTTDTKVRMSRPGDGTYLALDYVPPLLPEGWTSDVNVIPGDSIPKLGDAVYRDPADPQSEGVLHRVILVPGELAVDGSRDDSIKLAAEDPADVTTRDNPFRYWINDDDDSGDTLGSDIPGAPGSTSNGLDQTVNGTRDLIDFFPVFLDIKGLLTVLPADGVIKYKLKQSEGALNFVYSNLTRERALAYHKELFMTGFGDFFGQKPGEAVTHQVTANGFELSSAFLAGVKDNDWGVVLVEGRRPSAAPLSLVVELNGSTLAELNLDLRLSDVEAMFRHVDLTRVPTEYDGSPAIPPEAAPPSHIQDPGEPWPDSLTNGKYFVFLHGFNVDGKSARGWHAEVFKRLHVLGSKARFVGVTWNGATGIKIRGEYLDYHKAVFHAFQTGDKLAEALSFTAGADVTVAAHSLGNMVVSHAIQRGGYTPARYFMINAAVPVESYSPDDVSNDERSDMVERTWKLYGSRLTAADWHLLFGSSDHRSELTWENRFIRVRTEVESYNFFSPGDDVVANAEGVNSASLAVLLFRQGFDFSTGVWKLQELVKGVNWSTSGAALLMGRGQAGWEFNPAWYKDRGKTNSGPITSRRFPSEASESDVPTSALKSQPFFLPFLESDLFAANASIASAKAAEKVVQYDALARGIPSKSYAAAANRLLKLTNRNFNMQADGVGNRPLPTPQLTWRHSDIKVIAMPFAYPTYDEMIKIGGLK